MATDARTMTNGQSAATSPDSAGTASQTVGSGGNNGDQARDGGRISRIFVTWSAFIMLALGGVWVFTEYINHGGWPSGATLGAGGNGVWNLWIIYPVIAGVFLASLHRTITYVTK